MASLVSTIRSTLVPVHREGYKFIAIAAVAALILFFLGSWLSWPVVILALWIAYFFRDPARVTPVSEILVISPADGRVSAVGAALPPPELELSDEPLMRISVFMNVFNVHVNRSPVSGVVARAAYKPGKFLNAELDKASEDNERNGFIIETGEGKQYGVVQIAGLVARRIVPFAKEGEAVIAGDRIGLIRFGSRVDIYLPKGVEPLVAVGQTAHAGETVIAAAGTKGRDGTTYRVG